MLVLRIKRKGNVITRTAIHIFNVRAKIEISSNDIQSNVLQRVQL